MLPVRVNVHRADGWRGGSELNLLVLALGLSDYLVLAYATVAAAN